MVQPSSQGTVSARRVLFRERVLSVPQAESSNRSCGDLWLQHKGSSSVSAAELFHHQEVCLCVLLTLSYLYQSAYTSNSKLSEFPWFLSLLLFYFSLFVTVGRNGRRVRRKKGMRKDKLEDILSKCRNINPELQVLVPVQNMVPCMSTIFFFYFKEYWSDTYNYLSFLKGML